MQREAGEKNFPIWLLGDSEPENWKDKLDLPFDIRHPIRHNIWTSIIDNIQEIAYLEKKTRIDTSRIFIRNAVDNSNIKPKNSELNWKENSKLTENLIQYKNMIKVYKPKLILSFGAFAFEFGRRCLNENPEKQFQYWGAKRLGDEFRNRVINKENIKLIPLLHRSIAGGKFISSHETFCSYKNANYFNFVGVELAKIILQFDNIYI